MCKQSHSLFFLCCFVLEHNFPQLFLLVSNLLMLLWESLLNTIHPQLSTAACESAGLGNYTAYVPKKN